MFKKILIANRGEIACRVIKTAKKMGIHTVAVYSTADQNSLHVTLADEAVCIGEASAQESYLNIAAIIAAAQSSQSEAIHPGYGFLSENPKFAKACKKAGIVFIGPTVSAMEAMASKQLAKQRLEKTKVPLTPGYHGREQTDKAMLAAAAEIGFPLLLKAANGGGGKGMRAVHTKKELPAALAGARREALAFFGDDTLIIEKLITKPRHIEVQIMADTHGNIVHLFERDCSLQRRHQKIIEEAPAAKLSEPLRKQLTTAACEVARAIKYLGAGTVEFLVEENKHFYFMEMNTRLQVEHPVTEMITGLDLVEMQIKIADGLPLPCTQAEITKNGHAIECRIYAEDAEQNFMPSVGQIHFLREPSGKGVRLDTGVTIGSSVSQYYDPMIAKLIAWGKSRREALKRLDSALANYAIGGVKTNIAFLRAIIATPRFSKAEITTDFLSREEIALPQIAALQVLTAVAAYDYSKIIRQEHDPLWQCAFAWQSHLTSVWVWRYRFNNETYSLQIAPETKSQFTLTWQGQHLSIALSADNEPLVNEHQERLYCYFPDGVVTVERYSADDSAHAANVNDALTAPMPATVVAILKNKGEAVKQGERLLVLEAMKMEHTIHAPRDGVLSDICYAVGEQVHEGAELARIL